MKTAEEILDSHLWYNSKNSDSLNDSYDDILEAMEEYASQFNSFTKTSDEYYNRNKLFERHVTTRDLKDIDQAEEDKLEANGYSFETGV